MPLSAPRRCRRCNQLVRGRCLTCDAGWTRKPKTWTKGSTRRWRMVRAQQLADHPLCDTCGALATEVDHRDGCDYATQRYDPDWLRSLCGPCHARRTAEQGNEAQREAR